jgi:hypothetical protein
MNIDFSLRAPLFAVLVVITISRHAAAAEPARPVGVVSHVKVVSDKVADVSSLEAWQRSFIKDGMTDAQKAIAVWKSCVAQDK